jgi:5-(carboxyamino)imidazole ribonucleotide synthase
LRFQVLDPAADACAGQVATLIRGDYDAEARLEQLADWAEVVTFDFENVPATAALALERQVAVYPPPGALAAAQDRVSEKTLFWELGIPTPTFATVASLEELRGAVVRVELPAVLKTRRLGYDGKGQRILRRPEDVEPAWRALGGAPLILESFVPCSIRWWKITIATASCGCRARRIPRRNWNARVGTTPTGSWIGWITSGCWRSNSLLRRAG